MITRLPLYSVPLITVFTKYDQLVTEVEFGNGGEFYESTENLDPEMRNALLAEKTGAKFQELCVIPFNEVVSSGKVPHIAVSSMLQRDF